MADTVYTVTEVTRSVRDLLETHFGEVRVEGEVSNHRHHSSGHHYFTIKDGSAQLSCVMFRGNAAHLRIPLDNGQQVQVRGDLTVYEARGQYQLIVKAVQPKGFGSLQAKFEELKAKLAAEGLFDEAHKKPLPTSPQTIAIVTSPTGAAVQDFLNVVRRRAPWVRVLVYPARVQGQGGEIEIADAIRALSDPAAIGLPPIDTLIVARGGGSIEDLWNFNEEIVARAIYDCPIPVVSGVGHEIDFTIADFVADYRAPTPSAAAEMVVPDGAFLKSRLTHSGEYLDGIMKRWFAEFEANLAAISRYLEAREPMRELRNFSQTLDYLSDQLDRSLVGAIDSARLRLDRSREKLDLRHIQDRIEVSATKLQTLEQQLDQAGRQQIHQRQQQIAHFSQLLTALGPDNVLSRGFSLTTDLKGNIVHDAATLATGDIIHTRLAAGSVSSRVTDRE